MTPSSWSRWRVPAAERRRRRHPGQRRRRRPGRRCSASPCTASRPSCGRSPAALAFIAVFLRGGILGLPAGHRLGLRRPAAGAGRPPARAASPTCRRSPPAPSPSGCSSWASRGDHDVVARRPRPRPGRARRPRVAPRREVGTRTTRPTPRPGRRPTRSGPVPRRSPACRWCAGGPLGPARPSSWRWPLALPAVLSVDRRSRPRPSSIYAVLGLSLVVLSGWGGHVSLGQVAFFAIGAAVAGWVGASGAPTSSPGWSLATVVGAAVRRAGRAPALRLRGLYLAVTTFAFSLATTSYLLNDEFFDWVPTERIERPRSSAGSRSGLRRTCTTWRWPCSAGRPSACGACGAAAPAGPWWRCGTTTAAASRTASTRCRAAPRHFALSGAIAAFAGCAVRPPPAGVRPVVVPAGPEPRRASPWWWSVASRP